MSAPLTGASCTDEGEAYRGKSVIWGAHLYSCIERKRGDLFVENYLNRRDRQRLIAARTKRARREAREFREHLARKRGLRQLKWD